MGEAFWVSWVGTPTVGTDFQLWVLIRVTWELFITTDVWATPQTIKSKPQGRDPGIRVV